MPTALCCLRSDLGFHNMFACREEPAALLYDEPPTSVYSFGGLYGHISSRHICPPYIKSQKCCVVLGWRQRSGASLWMKRRPVLLENEPSLSSTCCMKCIKCVNFGMLKDICRINSCQSSQRSWIF